MPVAEDFDPFTVHVMDQSATLLRVARDLQGMVPTFTNSVDLDRNQARPDANLVLKFTRVAAGRLLRALFKSAAARQRFVGEVQAENMADLTDAIASAKVLADMERVALAGKGNVIERRVVAPLVQMQAIWQASIDAGATH